MSCKIELESKATFFLKKLAKKAPNDYARLYEFLQDDLANCGNPCILKNAKHLTGFIENYYRWKISFYRIIGVVTKLENGYLIQIVKIDKRKEDTYKGL